MDSKKIGKFIALNRKKKGLTQEQLGEKLGVSNKTISRWENGNYMPDLSLLEPLSKELGISLNELLAGEYIEKEKMIEYSEQNIKTTIDYTKKKINHEHKKISAFLIGSGVNVNNKTTKNVAENFTNFAYLVCSSLLCGKMSFVR